MYDVISSLSVHKIMPISDPGVESPKVCSIIMWHQPISQGENMPIWDQRVHPFWPAREKHCLQLTEPILDPLKKIVYGNLSDPSQPWDLSWIRYIYGYSPTTQPGRNVMACMINQQWGAPNYHTFCHSFWPPHQGQLRRDKDPYQTKDINQEEYTFLATMASKYIQHGPLEAGSRITQCIIWENHIPWDSSDWHLLPHAQQWWPVGHVHWKWGCWSCGWHIWKSTEIPQVTGVKLMGMLSSYSKVTTSIIYAYENTTVY